MTANIDVVFISRRVRRGEQNRIYFYTWLNMQPN